MGKKAELNKKCSTYHLRVDIIELVQRNRKNL